MGQEKGEGPLLIPNGRWGQKGKGHRDLLWRAQASVLGRRPAKVLCGTALHQPGFAKAKQEHTVVPENGDDGSSKRSFVCKTILAIWSQFNLAIKCFPFTLQPGENNGNTAKDFLVPVEQI